MKISGSVLAVLTLTSQLALAEAPVDTNIIAGDNAVAAGGEGTIAPAPAAATDSQIKSLERDLRPSLQSKLDALMDFEMESREPTLRVVASIE